MKLGLALHSGGYMDSVRQVAQNLFEILRDSHHVLELRPPADYASPDASEPAADDIVRRSDILIGFHSMLLPLLAARRRLSMDCPCVVFVLGTFPRGALTIRQLLPYLTTNDVLIATCHADVELAHKFLPDAHVTLLPLPFDDSAFYPLLAQDRAAVREQLGLTEQSQMLLYAGRLTVEKNLHTVLRVFAAVSRLQPDAHLLLAGPIQDVPFLEFGVAPLQYGHSIEKAILALQLPVERVRYLGWLDTERLRALYNAADAMINLTLHHDENFGLSQVEATACGTPVIGTAWGGLRDTIQDGINGYQVRTIVSPLGVKVNWWDAVNKTLLLLAERERGDRFDRATVKSTSTKYSMAQFRTRLDALLMSFAQGPSQPARPLTPSRFALEFWDICAPEGRLHAQYTPGSYSFRLYRELIASYANGQAACTPNEAAICSTDIVSLASPVTVIDNVAVSVSDPLYPFQCRLPEHLSETVRAVLAAMLVEPAIIVSRLTETYLHNDALTGDAIDWMLSQGLILRSQPSDGWLAPNSVHGALSNSPFTIQRVDRQATDFLVFE